jgi:hypothetical protein
MNETSIPFDRPAKNPREKVRADERLWVVPNVTTLTVHPFRLDDKTNSKPTGRTGERTATQSLASSKIIKRIK